MGRDKPNAALFKAVLNKMSIRDKCVWMVGDDPVRDIQGAREAIGAITLQKMHKGVTSGEGAALPDARFQEYGELVKMIDKLAKGAVHQS